MAEPSTWGEVAGAAAASAGSIAVEAARSKKQWKYQQMAMEKQQALNRETWEMQNAYNTPQQQMQRLQDAGLNPRLIYGEGSSAPNMAGPLDTAQAPVREPANIKSPDLMNYYTIRQMDAQWKQTTMATEIMEKNAALKDLQTGLESLKLSKETLRSKNYPGIVESEAMLQKWVSLRSRELFTNEERKGQNLLNQGYLMDQLGTMRGKQIQSLDLENAYKQHRNELAKLGINASDHPALRVLIQASKRMGIDLGELLQKGGEKLKYLLDLPNEMKK